MIMDFRVAKPLLTSPGRVRYPVIRFHRQRRKHAASRETIAVFEIDLFEIIEQFIHLRDGLCDLIETCQVILPLDFSWLGQDGEKQFLFTPGHLNPILKRSRG